MKTSSEQNPKRFRLATERWRALKRRDPGADGQFVYSVSTTGVYCRPNCPSRLARRQHIAFYDTCRDAERAGFRPCKRCRPAGASPRDRQSQAISRACRLIEGSDSTPPLANLAAAAGMSPCHFHRVFKRTVGLTPRQYGAARRFRKVRTELRTRRSVTDAIFEAGFSSTSRFYERSGETLGMTPGAFRRGGEGVEIRYAVAKSPLGLVLVAGTTRGICSVRFGESERALERELRREFSKATLTKADRSMAQWVRRVVRQIESPSRRIEVPLDIRGTAFQQRVWQALRDIPPGRTATYTDVAARIGKPRAIRAVASACAANGIAVLVPCHRVTRAGGALSGYRWGVKRKRKLLQREKAERGAPARRGKHFW